MTQEFLPPNKFENFVIAVFRVIGYTVLFVSMLLAALLLLMFGGFIGGFLALLIVCGIIGMISDAAQRAEWNRIAEMEKTNALIANQNYERDEGRKVEYNRREAAKTFDKIEAVQKYAQGPTPNFVKNLRTQNPNMRRLSNGVWVDSPRKLDGEEDV